jgi:hypothetical protein
MTDTRIPLTDDEMSLVKDLLQAEKRRLEQTSQTNETLTRLLVKLWAYEETFEGKCRPALKS